jgi:hypothetical protein
MPRPRCHDETQTVPITCCHACTRYLVVRQKNLWFIKFDGEEYGPYMTEREAMLFAIDAAQKLGKQGEEMQVLVVSDDGTPLAVWTYGQHPYRC